jgi:nitroreductase
MNTKTIIRARQACRAFTPEAIDKKIIDDILGEAIHTPSWGNTQPWEIFVAGGTVLNEINEEYLKNAEKKVPQNTDIPRPEKWPSSANERIRDLVSGVTRVTDDAAKLFAEVNDKFFYAPTVLYLCMDKSLTSWSMFDLGAISQSIMIAATARGIATMPAVELVHYPEVVRKYLSIPDQLAVVFGIALGYRDDAHPINRFKSTRRNLNDIVRYKGL